MVHVFLVESGCMLAFDMNLTFNTYSIDLLKEEIEKTCKIPIKKQVLLINGGYSLDSGTLVNDCSVGTDSNPIFLFNACTIESAEAPFPSMDSGSDCDLEEQLEAALALPPLYTTIGARCYVAQQFLNFAIEKAEACQRLVHEQHLQQQGWAAVVANLEEVSGHFKRHSEAFRNDFLEFLGKKKNYTDVLKQYKSDLELLNRIPVLEPLLLSSKGTLEPCATNQQFVSLYQWIHATERLSKLEGLGETCRDGLEKFQVNAIKVILAKVETILNQVIYTDMKEIKGLEERLYGLDQLMFEARKIVNQQSETVQAFSQNKIRAANIGDVSVLPDLCASHRDQLKMMLASHKQLLDVHRRCFQAKIELAENLHIRLRWIMMVEQQIYDTGCDITIYNGSLGKLETHRALAEQIHLAPLVYLRTVVEVVRRRAFSKAFLKWSKALSNLAADLHKNEMSARRDFAKEVGIHFLCSFFPGLNDYPPPYALETPKEFDAELPDIQPEDIEMLKVLLPDMVAYLNVPKVHAMPNITMGLLNPITRSLPDRSWNEVPVAPLPSYLVESGTNVEPLIGRECYHSALTDVQSVITAAHEVQEKVPKMEPATGDLLLESPRDERDPDESEPDTEEFEKVDGGAAVNDAGELREVSGIRASGSVQSVSNAALSLPLPTAPTVGPCLPYPAPPSPNEGERILASDDSSAACSSLQDFLTADFYIDESMPSSYTESNGTTGTGWGVARGQAIKSHHVIVAELQHMLEEKSAAITQLQEESCQSRQHLHDLENRLRQIQQLDVLPLRNDVSATRQLTLQIRDDFVNYLVTLSVQLTDVIGLMQHRAESERDQLLEETLSKVQSEHQAAIDNLSQQLAIESQKLNDAHNEIQRVRDQLQRSDEIVERKRQEADDKLEMQKQEILLEHYETIKKMTLEHELELEAMRGEHQKECKNMESALQEIREDLWNEKEELAALKRAQSLEQDRLSERLQEETTRMVTRLQEEFLIREQASIEKSLEEAKQTYEEEMKWLRQKNKDLSASCDQKEELMSCLAKELESKADQERKVLRDLLSKEHRQEMEGLRARFRLAFNTAGMERSPSECSLEKIERPDSADPSRVEQQVSALKAELEEKDAAILKLKQKHDRELQDLAQQINKAKRDSLRYMRTSLTAEKQVIFNEAVNKATAEKEATIQDLRLQLKALHEELQGERLLNARINMKDESFSFSMNSERSESSPVLSRPDSGNFHMVSPVTPRRSESTGLLGASVVSPILEQPLSAESNSLEIGESSGPLGASVFVSPASEQPTEPETLEGSISASASAVSVPEKVSVYTCNVGDLVILLFDDKHDNYTVFSTSSTYHFLHHDCSKSLSLNQSATGEKGNWLLARITNKEYCQARKEVNRFNVPIGTRFYRVCAKPVPLTALRRSQSSSKKKLPSQTGNGSS